MMQFGAGQKKGKKVSAGNKDALLIRPSGGTRGRLLPYRGEGAGRGVLAVVRAALATKQ